jgi:hypothetical protein
MTFMFGPIGDGLSPASLAMHVGLGNQPPLGSSLHSSSHYFANFSGLGMNGESRHVFTFFANLFKSRFWSVAAKFTSGYNLIQLTLSRTI